MKLTVVVCDLCHLQQPSVFCSSDSAFLCSDCDSQVHTANFLVARHIRLPLCSICKSYHSHSTKSCDHHDDDDDDDAFFSSSSSSLSSSSSTTCISSTTKSTTTSSSSSSSSSVVSSSNSQDWKTRDLLMNWCARLLGVGSNMSSVIEVAKHAFQVWWVDRSTAQLVEWPYRVGLAASLWLGLLRLYVKEDDVNDKNKRIRMRVLLKRLEEISGVPAKSILVAHSRLAAGMLKKTMKRRREDHVEECWDEC